MKKILAGLLGLMIIAGVLFAGAAGAYSVLNKAPDGKTSGAVRFTVEKGLSLKEIAFDLRQADLIKSSQFFRLLAKMKKVEGAVKSGVYDIPEGSSALSILELLVEGRQQLTKVTIPEGKTLRKTAQILEEHNIIAADVFIETATRRDIIEAYGIPGESLEGFLFPDTYFFPEEYEAELVIEIFLRNFYTQLDEIYPSWEELGPRELEQKITMASIIEREYRVAAEAPLIASVFYNRLSKNIGLNSCATIEYIITEIQGREHPEYLTYRDLEIDSAFNTYKWAGLTPHPICSPGPVALRASFQPAETDFYYFVLKDPASGSHHFSKTNDEHIEAKRLYLKE